MHYAEEKFKPRAMISVATLTGAIAVALGMCGGH
jgi:leucyl aminopeptidase